MKDLKEKLYRFSNSAWPYVAIVFVVSVFFWKVLFQGLIPLPGDFVVGVYYPWLDYKWGYSTGVPVKNPILADVPSFVFPMQNFAVNLIKNGKLPLWNPLILAGTPLLANFQSAPFSPTNFLYFIFDNLSAWSIQIILSHIFAAIFIFLLLRYWEVSKFAAILGGIIFSFSGFSLIWGEWNGHTLTTAFIPLIVLLTDKWLEEKKILIGIGLSFTLALQILSGYPQVVIYTYISLFLLLVVRFFKNIRNILPFAISICGLIFFIVLGFGLSALQTLPGAELLKNSQRIVELHPYDWTFLPMQKIITFIASDYFGNHATQNYWGPQDYTSNEGFVGIIGFILSSFALFSIKKKKEIGFTFLVIVISLILSFPTPVSIFLWKSGILGFNAASAHRALVLFTFGVAILAAFGYDSLGVRFKSMYKYKILIFIIPSLLLSGFGFYAFKIHQLVGLKNLILPSVILLGCWFIIFFAPKFKLVLMLLAVSELFYFGWKFTPFSSRNLIFPETPVLNFLEKQQKPFRVVADKVIPINFLMNYRIETLEGYDAVYPKDISEYISKVNGNFGSFNSIRRYAIIDNYGSDLLDLANVRYLVIKKESASDYLKNPKFKFVFEDKSVDILENLKTYPRAFILGDEKILNSKIEFTKYETDNITLSVNSKNGGELVISNSFYPGWRVYVDDREEQLNKFDEVFQSVNISSGKHIVNFVYLPNSFFNGLKISAFSLVALISLIGYTLLVKRKNVKN